MPRLMSGVGKPVGAIIQYAYTVADIDEGIAAYSKIFHVGPWFRWGPFTPAAARYRGEYTGMTVTLARAFIGDTMIELIQQHDDGPSVYREVFEARGHGFHHWAITSDDPDADIARLGYPVVFEDHVPTGARVTYVDARRDLPGMIEILELTPDQEDKYADFHRASAEWDGTTDPVRAG